MTPTTFISWSGDNSKAIASSLQGAIHRSLPEAVTLMQTPDDYSGHDDWYQRLKGLLAQSNIVVLVITPESQNSSWMPWELGIVQAATILQNGTDANLSNVPLYPMTFGIELFQKDLPIRANRFPHSQDSLERVLKGIAEHAKIDWKVGPEDCQKFCDEVWRPFDLEVSRLRTGLRVIDRRENWIAGCRNQLSAIHRESRDLIDDRLFAAIDGLLRTYDEAPDAFEEILQLIGATDRSIKLPNSPDSQWILYDNELAMRWIREATDAVTSIGNGIAGKPPTEGDREYYKQMLARVQNSMWTVNVGAYEGSYGRSVDADILFEHSEIGARGGEMERVFVVQTAPDAEPAALEERGKLSDVLATQRGVGVNTLVISQRRYKQIYDDNIGRFAAIGSKDFNILDDQRVYITQFSTEKENFVSSTKLIKQRGILESAIYLKNQINKNSIQVSKGKIPDSIFTDSE